MYSISVVSFVCFLHSVSHWINLYTVERSRCLFCASFCILFSLDSIRVVHNHSNECTEYHMVFVHSITWIKSPHFLSSTKLHHTKSTIQTNTKKNTEKKDMHRIKSGSEINFTFTWKFHPPNGCHKFNQTKPTYHSFFGIFFLSFYFNARSWLWYFLDCFPFHLGFLRHHHLLLTFFLRSSHLRF